MSEREPYLAETPGSIDPQQLTEFLERELRRIENALQGFEETLQVTIQETTANVGASSIQLLDCSATAVVLSLPSAVGNKGKAYTFKKTDSSANKAAVRAVSSETIDGAGSASLTAQYQVKRIVSDGDNWHVI